MATEPTTQPPQGPETPTAPPVPAAERKGLDKEDTALCLQALQQLRAGLSQALLYTLESKQFEKAAENTFTAVNALLEKIGGFNLNIVQADALVNGARVEIPASRRTIVEAIEKVMNAAGVSGLRIEKGLAMAELGQFLQLLARKKLGSTDGAKINQFLREQNISHVQTEELRYVMISAREKVVSVDAPGLAHAVAQSVVGGITADCVQTMRRVEDAVAREQLRAEMTEQLLEQDPELLGSMLAAALPRLKDPAHENLCALVALPQRDGQLLRETLHLAQLLAQNGQLRDEVCAQPLRELITRLAAPYRSRAEDVLANLPLEQDWAGLLPDWLAQAYASVRGGSAAERLDGVLTQSPNTLLDEQMFPQIVDVLDELSVARMEAEAERLMQHVSGALRAVTKGGRMKAVQRLSFLLAHLMEQASPAVQILENSLLEACTHETCDEVMRLLLKHLSERCVHHYRLGNFARALEHLRGITSLEESSRLAMRDEGANLARQARETLAQTPFAAQLAQDCLAGGEKSKVALQMAAVLGQGVWTALIERLRTETDPQVVPLLAAQLKSFGREAVQLFFTTLGQQAVNVAQPPSAVHAAGGGCATTAALLLLSVGPTLDAGDLLWKHLPPLLRHADENVRARALEGVVARADEPAAAALAGALREESEQPRRAILLNALTRLAHPAALQTLLAELETAASAAQPDEAYLLALLEALKATGKEDFVPSVIKLLAGRGRTKTPGGGVSKPVTMAAIKALARFHKQAVVSETLERLRKDTDPDVSRLALVALRGILAAEQEAELKKAAPAPAATPVSPAAPASSHTAVLRKTRRPFEALESQIHAESVFKIGAGIGTPVAQPFQTVLQTGKPVLPAPVMEGVLRELGLAGTLQAVGGRNGVLKINGEGHEGSIFVKNHKITNACFADKSDLAALAGMGRLKNAHFAFYLKAEPPRVSLDLDVDEVKKVLGAES